ncbi:MAG: DUF445 domain-containing protein [Veillonellales bacterium]
MRNRKAANRTLAVVFLLFIVTLLLRLCCRDSLLLEMGYTTLEAALVGGIADWFAVTALFGKPLGFPWHTAIIPRSRLKIVEALVRSVQYELLSKESIRRRLTGIHLVRSFIRWVEEKNDRGRLAAAAAKGIQAILTEMDTLQAAGRVESFLKKQWQIAQLAPWISRIIRRVLGKRYDERLIDGLLEELIRYVRREQTKAAIYQYLERYSSQMTDSWWKVLIRNVLEAVDAVNLAEAAEALQVEILVALQAVRQPDHPLRPWLRQRMSAIALRLEQDTEFAHSINSWQVELIDRISLKEVLSDLIERGIDSVKTPADGQFSPIMAWLSAQILQYWEQFKTDTRLQDWIEGYVQEAVNDILETEHHLVGAVTRSALDGLTDRSLNQFIEEKAGDDLQWIRINGSVVGGIVGLLLFVFLHFLYVPVLIPVLQTWLQG